MSAIIAAIITVAGGIITALIARRPPLARTPAPVPAGTPAPLPGMPVQLMPRRVSAAVWLGIASLVCWLLPLVGLPVCFIGAGIALRDMKQGSARKYAAAGLALLAVGLLLTLINAAIGAYQGYNGTLFQ